MDRPDIEQQDSTETVFVARIGESGNCVARGTEASVRREAARYESVFSIRIEPDNGTGRLLPWIGRWWLRRFAARRDVHGAAGIDASAYGVVGGFIVFAVFTLTGWFDPSLALPAVLGGYGLFFFLANRVNHRV